MAQEILITGDLVIFDSTSFGQAIVVAPPGTMAGSGSHNTSSAAACIEGDEGNVSVTCIYSTTTGYSGGSGLLTIESLAADQVSTSIKSGGTYVLLKGSSTFEATMTVLTPAFSNNGSDTNTSYSGTGSFITMNLTVVDGSA